MTTEEAREERARRRDPAAAALSEAEGAARQKKAARLRVLRLNASVDLQNARRAVEKARQALTAAEDCFDADLGVVENSPVLIRNIRSAERRLADAHTELTKAQLANPEQSGPRLRHRNHQD
jgi:hypothetical protein